MTTTKVNLANTVEGILPVANGGTGTSTGVAPGGSTTQVQYNNAGAFAGSANLVWDNTNTRLGIGGNPSYQLDIRAASTPTIRVFETTNGPDGRFIATASDVQIGTYGGSPFSFYTNAAERMRISSAGNVSIGQTATNFKLTTYGAVASQWITPSGEDPAFVMGDTALAAAGIWFGNTFSSNNGAYMVFKTRDPSSGTVSERFRFGSLGQLGIGGATYGSSGQVLTSQGSGAAPSWVTPTTSVYSIDYLVVAGGGAGGTSGSGTGIPSGGGAGGYQSVTSASVGSGIPYSVTVGSGGIALAGGNANRGGSGGISSFLTTVSIGGGGGSGGRDTDITGQNGGSGGGGGGGGAGTGQFPGANTAGQGNFGGRGSTAANAYGGGGGGGAGAAGSNGSGSAGGNGGAGTAWLNGTTYAGGGGGGVDFTFGSGGAGGAGGGGAGAQQSNTGTAGTANTGGGGGGGGGQSATGGAGGSGVVIIRYSGSQRGTGGTVTSAGGFTYHTFTSSGTYTA